MKTNNPSAFPFQSRDASEQLDAPELGMTLMDYFAAKALSAMIGNESKGIWGKATVVPFAKYAYEFAQAMLEERERLLKEELNKLN